MSDLKLAILITLLLLYAVMGVMFIGACIVGVDELHADGVFIGVICAILYLIPAGYIGYYLYQHSDYGNNN